VIELADEFLVAHRPRRRRLAGGRRDGFALARLALVIATAVDIGRGGRPRVAVALPLAGRVHEAEVMLGMLIGVLRRGPVAARLGLAGQRDVALEDLVGVAANFDVRAVAVEGLRAMRRPRARAAATAATTVMRHATVAPARSLVLSWPHATCL